MMMRGEDLMRQPDHFWDVRKREQIEEETLTRECAEIQTQIDLARRVESIRHAPGFQDVLKSMQALHLLAREKLVGDDTLSDHALREQRGRVRGIESCLALFTKPQITEVLAARLAERKNLLAEAMIRRPKPKTEDQTKVTT